MAYIQLKINMIAEHAESLGDMLSANGAQAVTFVDAKDTPLYEPKPGEVMLWPDTQVIGLFPAEMDMQAVITRLSKARILGEDFVYVLDPLEDKDWEREWMENFHAMQFGKRLWICPSWREIPEPNAVNVMLDPGLAFGTGTHATTALCLQWLDGLDLTGKSVLDFGCGSGILGVAAVKLGASAMVGIDIDPQALQATRENASRNHVSAQVEAFLPEHAPAQQYDVVLANILAAPLRELKTIIAGYCQSGGQIILSGILVEQAEEIANLYSEFFVIDHIAHSGEWASINGTKR
ncbi:50S ribosomal protein L11 methyltransferase [Alteromonas sp. LMIT006]|jgi:ribosomal protein L11 methyltransferase|uniref:50S ribosomal protein L11 methyltransferase n=1 Tax=Alteromonadaceae TaxID=72275 RepID=UPI0020CA50BE|nr:50S ribosomal protein L11 methyltransferase [Alteromonas sp. LMIT006]UTP73091.1 50S ribosomal protein L11 methyltransferase [Alteromonas sp. LMIT006]